MSFVLAITLLVALPLAQEPNRAHIRGQFVDGAGHGVASASVLNRVWPGAEFPVQSDGDGRFEATGEWPAGHGDTWYECTVRVLGCERWSFDGKLVPGQELDLGVVRLQPGGAVSGRVRLESALVGDAQILVVAAEKLPGPPATRLETGAPTGPSFTTAGVRGPDYERPLDRGTSANDGNFRIVGLAPGRYGLWLRCEASFWATSAAFEVRAGEETKLAELALEPLPPNYWIEGTVVDPDGVPVPDAQVEATPVEMDENCFGGQARTGADGRFRVYVFPLACGAVELRALVEGESFYETRQSSVQPGRRDIVLRLGRMHELELVVRDVAGRPVEDFGFTLWRDFGDHIDTGGNRSAPRPGGRCVVHFPERARVRLTLEAVGFEDAEVELDPLRRELEIALQPAKPDETRRISGRVTAGGLPVPGAHVDLARRDIDRVDDLVARDWIGVYEASDGDCVIADAQGRFRFVDDYPWEGTYVATSAAGYAQTVVGPFETDQAGIELALTAGGDLRGRLQLPGGALAGEVALRAYRSDVLRDGNCMVGREFRTRTDASGAYRFEHLQAGTWLLSVELSPGKLQELGWSAADGELCRRTPFAFDVGDGRETAAEIELAHPEGPCRLRGQLTVAGMTGAGGYAWLELDGPQALRLASASMDSSGHFQLSARAPGRYRLVVDVGRGCGDSYLVTDLVTLAPGDTDWVRHPTRRDRKDEGVRLDRP